MEKKTAQKIAMLLVLFLSAIIINFLSFHLFEKLRIENQHPFHNFFWNFESRENYTDFWTIYWGIASLIVVILAILIVKNYFEKETSREVQTEVKTGSKPSEWDKNTIDTYRIALQKNYNSISNSQAVRLLGSIAALFTFIELTSIVESELAELGPLKVLGFVLVASIFIFFSFRAFFRFSLFSMFAAHIKWINNKEIDYLLEDDKNLRGQNTMALLHAATAFKISGKLRRNNEDRYKARKLYHLFPCRFFIVSGNRRHDIGGYLICMVLTSVSMLILIGLLL
jgi:hypothetical protein